MENILYLKKDVINKTQPKGFNLFDTLYEMYFNKSSKKDYVMIRFKGNLEVPQHKYTQFIIMFFQTAINNGYTSIIFETK